MAERIAVAFFYSVARISFLLHQGEPRTPQKQIKKVNRVWRIEKSAVAVVAAQGSTSEWQVIRIIHFHIIFHLFHHKRGGTNDEFLAVFFFTILHTWPRKYVSNHRHGRREIDRHRVGIYSFTFLLDERIKWDHH